MVNDGKGVHTGENFKCDFKMQRDEDFWSVEFFVPFNELFRNATVEIRAGTRIVKANFIRNRVLEKKPHRCRFMSRWRTTYGGSNLDVKSFGDLVIRDDSSHFGNKKLEVAVLKGENFWNLEFFVPFTSVFYWTYPDPALWRDSLDMRFSLAPFALGNDTPALRRGQSVSDAGDGLGRIRVSFPICF